MYFLKFSGRCLIIMTQKYPQIKLSEKNVDGVKNNQRIQLNLISDDKKNYNYFYKYFSMF